MERRSFIAIASTAATASLAGCIFGDDKFSTELSDGESESFEASEGDEYEVTVDVTDGDEVSVRIMYDMEKTSQEFENEEDAMSAVGELTSGPLLDESVEGESTFDLEIETDGYYEVAVSGGTAEITVA
ncbi:hypothetical protein [Halopiger djelfimassiliensis]|uniref:hypothetical protein n=1 Tax=Halopiger djelfimassiliensis TaxID=1293047 RepID=UPI000677E247|nr:hypothetical protein [Halopiger djelfimassiliensis]